MINLKKEFQELKNKNMEDVLQSLYVEKNELKIKIYILSVIHCITSLKKVIKSPMLSEENVEYIEFHKYYDYDYGNVLKFKFLDKNKIERCIDSESNQIESLLDDFYIESDFCNPELMPEQLILLKTNEEDLDKLYDLFLNKHLKSIMDASLLDNELPTNEMASMKKNKI